MSQCTLSSGKRKRKLEKLQKNIYEIALLDKEDMAGTSADVEKLSAATENELKDLSLLVSRKRHAVISSRKTPKLFYRAKQMPDLGISSEDLATLVHFGAFHHSVNKPRWAMLSDYNSVLQVVLLRVSCDLEIVTCGKENSYLENFFGAENFERMKKEVNNRRDFWKALLNVPHTKIQKLKMYLQNGSILDQYTSATSSRCSLLVPLKAMVEFNYPFPVSGRGPCPSSTVPAVIPLKKYYTPLNENSPLFAIDCEMCSTEYRLELTRFTLINDKYEVLLDTLVKPSGKIIDYHTKYSGITEEMMENVDVNLKDVQDALIHILPKDAILVGHTLDCDLNALRLTHPYCIDISLCFNLSGSQIQRTSLKTLSRIFLNEAVQDMGGHCSVEDAVAAMKLLNLKLKNGPQFGNVLMGWNFENWAKENGLTSSGGRFRDCMKPKSENGDCEKLTVASNSADKMREKGNDSLVNAAEGIDTNVMKNGELELVQNKDSEPARKRRSAGQGCMKCLRPLGVPCIVWDCFCQRNRPKYCVKCAAESPNKDFDSSEPKFDWVEMFKNCKYEDCPLGEHLKSTKDKTAFYALPDDVMPEEINERETYVNSKEFSDIKSLAERVSQEVMMHNLVCVDFEMPNGTENTKKKFSLIDDAIKEVISYASYHSLNLVVLTSPQESLCYAAIKDRPMP